MSKWMIDKMVMHTLRLHKWLGQSLPTSNNNNMPVHNLTDQAPLYEQSVWPSTVQEQCLGVYTVLEKIKIHCCARTLVVYFPSTQQISLETKWTNTVCLVQWPENVIDQSNSMGQNPVGFSISRRWGSTLAYIPPSSDTHDTHYAVSFVYTVGQIVGELS